MKRTLWGITLSSILTLVVYLVLNAIWRAILKEIASQLFALLLFAFMMAAAFGMILVYISKIRSSVGEDEVVSDYQGQEYISLADDLKRIIKRESPQLICMTAIVLACFVLNRMDVLLFGKKTFSAVTLVFAPMCLFDTLFTSPFVGYLLSAVVDVVIYLTILLFYRRKKYNYWMKK